MAMIPDPCSALCALLGVEDLEQVTAEQRKKMTPEQRHAYFYERIKAHGKKYAIDAGLGETEKVCDTCKGKGWHKVNGRVKDCRCKDKSRIAKAQSVANIPVEHRHRTLSAFETDTMPRRSAHTSALHLQGDLRTWLRGGDPPVKGLFIHGQTGTRKTTLATSIANGLITPGCRNFFFVEAAQLSIWIQAAYGKASAQALRAMPPRISQSAELGGGEPAVLTHLYVTPVLILDDLYFGRNAESMAKWLELIVYARKASNLPTIMTTNHTTTELTHVLKENMVSRLKSQMLWVDLGGADSRKAGGFSAA